MMLVVSILVVSLAQNALAIWDGVYTRAQADRGKVVYEARCSRCHDNDLRGVRGAALAGDAFMTNWEARSIGRLFRMIRDTMPPEDTGALTESQQLETVAFVLQQNGFPAGATELVADPAILGGIQIRAREPMPLRTGALVQASGCLAQDADGWLLADSTELERTSLEDQAANRPSPRRVPGARAVRLLNVFPNPAPHRGHTMLAKGFLVRDREGDRVNVVELEMIDSICQR